MKERTLLWMVSTLVARLRQYLHIHILSCPIVCQSNNSEDTCKSEEEVLSAGAVAGIAAVTLLLALPVGVVIGLGVAWNVMRRVRDPTSEGHQQKSQQVQEAIYEEPPETTIPLSNNQAYGHIDTQRKN